MLFKRARVDADEAQLLHEGVDAGLEDLRDQRPVGIGHDVDHLLVGGDGGAVDRIGRQAAEDQGVEQFLHAHARLGRAADDGDQRAAGDGLDDQPGELLVARLDAVEVAGHHVLVDLDDRLDERGVDVVGIDQRPAVSCRHLERAGHAAEIAALAQGNIQKLAGLAEHLLDVLHQRGEVDVVGVHLVDGDEAAQAGLARLVEDPAGGHADAALGVDLDDHRVDGVHRADRLPDEVRVAGGVDGIEPLAVVVEVHDVGLDRVVVDLLFLVEIADARALVDAGRTRDRARHGEDLVQEGRLSRGPVSAECHVANICDWNLCHCE